MSKIKLFFIFQLLMITIQSSFSQNNSDKSMTQPPFAKEIRKELTAHGITRIDNYYWLNDRSNQEVINYLNKENDYTKKCLQHTEKLQDDLYKEIVGRIKQTDNSVPYKNNGYFYITRYEEGKEYPIYCRKKDNLESPEEILLNVNDMAKGYQYYQAVGLAVTQSNSILSFGIDTVSRRIYTIYFKDLKTGKLLVDKIENTTGSAVWANDNKTVFYSKQDESLRSYQIYRHTLGTNSKKDELIFEEKDETYSCFVYKTKSKKYIVIGSSSTLSQEYKIVSADKPEEEFKVFQPRIRELEYSIEHFDDKFYVVTNLNAKNFRLMECQLTATSKENWKEVLPHRADVLLEGIEVFSDFLVVQERSKGLTQLRIINQKTKGEHYIDFGEQTYTAWVSVNMEFNTNILRFGYSSLTTPSSTFDYNMSDKEKKLLKQEEVVGGYNASEYQAERLYAKADDGTLVPISIVYKKGIKKESSNPLLLYAYGSYGYSTDPYFSSVRLSLLNRGFIYAIAHIRGGQEMGRDWYENGKLFKKKNTFTDFISCAQYLIEQKYTSKEKLFASGGSAGGLLIGAVVNIKPEIFKGALAAVPFVDVVTTMLDSSIPLTTGEYDEWGNPNDKAFFDYMLSYSPYDNVEKKDYPNLLVTTGLHDSQVQYWEPAKWVAKLRKMKTDKNLLLLDTDMSTGHGGASGRFERYKKVALEYAFFLDLAK